MLCAASLLLISATSCSKPEPPVVSGDLSCERFRHISATPAQINVLVGDEDLWGSYTDQIVAHNIEYDKACVGKPVSDPRGKSK